MRESFESSSREALLRRRLGPANSFLLHLLGDPLPDDDALRAALTTAAVASLFVVVAPVYALLIYLLEQPPPVYYGLAALTLLTALTCLALLRHGWYRFAAHFLLAGGTTIVSVTFPSFVTRKLNVIVSPTAVVAVASELFTISTLGVVVSGVARVSSSETGPAVAVWPFTVAVLSITPASTSACVTT